MPPQDKNREKDDKEYTNNDTQQEDPGFIDNTKNIHNDSEPEHQDQPVLEDQPQEVEEEGSHRSQPDLDQPPNSIDDLASEKPPEPVENIQTTNQSSFEEVHIPNLRSPQRQPLFNGSLENSNRNTFAPKYNTPPKSGKGSKVQLIILLLVSLAVIGGTVYLLKNNFMGNKAATTETATPTPTPTMTPTPTPEPINRAEITVRVLNGTPKTGFASTISTKLKDLGYKTERVGNATNSAFTTTLVRVKDSVPSGLLEQIIKDLSPDLSAESSSPLRSSDAADVEVILGEK